MLAILAWNRKDGAIGIAVGLLVIVAAQPCIDPYSEARTRTY